MSLPSQAIFYLKEKEVSRQFVNIGWFITDNALNNLIMELDYPEEWDILHLYYHDYTIAEIIKRAKRMLEKERRRKEDKWEMEIMFNSEKEKIISLKDEDFFI